MAMLRCDTFRMELDAMDRKVAVTKAHDTGSIQSGCLAGRVDRQAIGYLLDYKRMIPRGGIGGGESGKNPAPVMRQLTRFAVHQSTSDHLAAKMLADRLMAQANA